MKEEHGVDACAGACSARNSAQKIRDDVYNELVKRFKSGVKIDVLVIADDLFTVQHAYVDCRAVYGDVQVSCRVSINEYVAVRNKTYLIDYMQLLLVQELGERVFLC